MGFMDKAKQFAEQAQQKVDEVQQQFNDSQAQGGGSSTEGAQRFDANGRPIAQPGAGPDAGRPDRPTDGAQEPSAEVSTEQPRPGVKEGIDSDPDPFKPLQ